MYEWLFAIDDPECYIRPIDLIVCTMFMTLGPIVGITLLGVPIPATLGSEYSLFSAYLAFRWVVKLRDF
jgi:hypothetical protein